MILKPIFAEHEIRQVYHDLLALPTKLHELRAQKEYAIAEVAAVNLQKEVRSAELMLQIAEQGLYKNEEARKAALLIERSKDPLYHKLTDDFNACVILKEEAELAYETTKDRFAALRATAELMANELRYLAGTARKEPF